MTPPAPVPTLDRLRPGDRERVRRWLWLGSAHSWWSSPDAGEAELAIAFETESAICRMVVSDGAAIGYGHAIEGQLLGGDLEAGLWECAILIGAGPGPHTDVAAAALDALAAEVFASTFATACAVRIPVKLEASVRAVEHRGFRWRAVDSRTASGPTWIMVRERARR